MTLRLSSAKKDSVHNIFLYTLERFRAVLLFYAILLALLGPMSLLVQFWKCQEMCSRGTPKI